MENQKSVLIKAKDHLDMQMKSNAIARLGELPVSGKTLTTIADLMSNPGAEESFNKAINNPIAKALFK